MPAYTVAIGGRNETSAGIRALHILRDELQARGHEAAMSYDRVIPGSVAVYPEIEGGNPLGAKRIARWLLGAAPNLPDGVQFQWGGGMDPKGSPVLCVDLLEPDIWFPRSGPRSGVGYWIGRGGANFDQLNQQLNMHGLVELPTGRNGFRHRRELADWLAGLDFFISFDPYTAVITEAINVGTPVQVLAAPDDPRLRFGMGNEWNRFGVAWTPGHLDYARDTVGHAYSHYRDVCVPEFGRQVDRFVELTSDESMGVAA